MKLRKHLFLAVLVVSLTGLLTSSGNGLYAHGPESFFQGRANCARVAMSLHGQMPQTAHEEKRHRKTLVPQAIVANFSLPRRPFMYCCRSYSLFLPGGCAQRPPEHASLRGPPFCS